MQASPPFTARFINGGKVRIDYSGIICRIIASKAHKRRTVLKKLHAWIKLIVERARERNKEE